MLICVLYSQIENYVCIKYLSCQYKTLSSIYSNRIFEQTSLNILLGIGIPEVLLSLLSCHGFTEKPNSTVILNIRYRLVNNHLSKGFFIIKKNSKHLSILPNDMKFIIRYIEQLETDLFWQQTN